ncbi:sulfurtransferase [Psychromonas sp. psych-6C06]|uniref:rhodanese-like domain-containing protein n=1 Tax=Psychromonas sp. psych-6C06 TaxID=2058089 RepID=UPI000C31D28F|nr:rhodanese-like domain-containing protein [Psychromonas sp. psych-6C06]PKF61043.1 sulfurtransferase [Psychromonas sp. psych-6C06]
MHNLTLVLKKALILLLFVFPILSHAEAVWVDVRSPAEHQINHIEGDLLIPHTEIVNTISKLFPNKETPIHLYCRSGNRAGIAQQALNKLGYKNVFNEGSIEQARQTQQRLKAQASQQEQN